MAGSYYFGPNPSARFRGNLNLSMIVIGGGVRNPKGVITDISNRLETVYTSVARQLQEAAAQEYQSKMMRKSVSTGRLARATLAVGNRHTTNSSMQVGIKKHLDQATRVGDTGEGGYHILIEEGTQGTNYLGPMVDRSGVPLYGSWVPGNSPYSKTRRDQTLLPFNPTQRALIEARAIEAGWKIPTRRRDIKGVWAYRKAWNRVDPVATIKREWRQHLIQSGFNVGTRGALPADFPKGYRL